VKLYATREGYLLTRSSIQKPSRPTPLDHFYGQIAEAIVCGMIDGVVFGEGDQLRQVALVGYKAEESEPD
jgi:hypothetical protein